MHEVPENKYSILCINRVVIHATHCLRKEQFDPHFFVFTLRLRGGSIYNHGVMSTGELPSHVTIVVHGI